MSKKKNPYSDLPDHCFWSRSHRVAAAAVDPVVKGGFKLNKDMKIATAGSCFAQHIARHLRKSGFNYFIAEEAHPIIRADVAQAFNYGVFSARYGNLYTTRQLLQLVKRADGSFVPQEDVWQGEDGTCIDPYRPNIQPNGFSRVDDFRRDRVRHFAAVNRILDEADVFVFTLGLTEAWRAKADGAVFPLAPGVAGGQFDPKRHEFVNFGVDDIVSDFKEFAGIMRKRNPKVKIILTVSPVPLIATARADQSVITATAYSKAVLRVAAEKLCSDIEDCFYFPSYEVITGNFNRGRYFGEDFREVKPAGVGHVMKLFMKHYTDMESAAGQPKPTREQPRKKEKSFVEDVGEALQVICDEEMIERNRA